MRFKVYEPLLVAGLDKFSEVDIRVRVSGGGHTSQIYAIRQAIAKGIVAYYQKFVDEASKNHVKHLLGSYDRTLLVADNRRCEPKKFGGALNILEWVGGLFANALDRSGCQSQIPKVLPLSVWIWFGVWATWEFGFCLQA